MDEIYSSLLAVHRTDGGVHVVRILANQAVDELPILKMEADLKQLIDEGARKMIIDFADVDHFSSSGLGMLLNVQKYIQAHQGTLKLCQIKSDIYEVFKITRLNEVFAIHKTAKGALADFKE